MPRQPLQNRERDTLDDNQESQLAGILDYDGIIRPAHGVHVVGLPVVKDAAIGLFSMLVTGALVFAIANACHYKRLRKEYKKNQTKELCMERHLFPEGLRQKVRRTRQIVEAMENDKCDPTLALAFILARKLGSTVRGPFEFAR